MPELTILSPSEQVAEHLRGELLRGRWSSTMPGVPTLAAELGVDHKAVASAIGLLERDGLLLGQGVGRPRRIVLPENHAPPALRVAILNFDSPALGADYMIELRHILEEAGHMTFVPGKSLADLGMDVGRVASFVGRTKADAWVISAASRPVLEWFSTSATPAFALFGRRRGVPIAAAGPDKPPVCAEITRHLIALGHRRISMLVRKQHRLPKPGGSARAFVKELEAAGIPRGAFNLPDWEESKEGFGKLLSSLFEHTPPTALILDEAFLFNAAVYFLSKRGLRMPEDVSLICTDSDPGFAWCDPTVAHIRWDYRPVVRRVARWANNVAKGENDRRQTLTKAEFVDGGTVGRAPGTRAPSNP